LKAWKKIQSTHFPHLLMTVSFIEINTHESIEVVAEFRTIC